MRKGSITIFAALSLMLVASVLFVLLEGVRVKSGEVLAQQNTEAVVESLFSQYEIPLWENYHLLARFVPEQEGNLALGELEQEAAALTQINMNPEGILLWKNHMIRMKPVRMAFLSYSLLTDDRGKAYQAAVTSYMKQNPVSALLTEQNSDFKSLLEGNTEGSSSSVEKAWNSIEAEKEKAKQENNGGAGASFGTENTQAAQELKENPLEVVMDFQTKGILNLVLENTNELSNKKISLENAVSHRTLIQGTSGKEYEESWYDPLLIQQYYQSVFSDFHSKNQGTGLSYEMEYLLCGEEGDLENLKGVVYRLLAVREAANLITLASDAARQNEALVIATAIGGFTGNPAVIEVVKVGVLAAWAFIESILDIRALLQGEKIPLIKTSQQWTSDIWGLSDSVGGYAKAKHCSYGMDYSQYLQNLLFFQEGGKTAYRAMDLQEIAINQIEGYEDFRMDQAVISLEVEAAYEMESLFLSNITIGNVKSEPFYMESICEYSYLKAGE